VNELEVAFLAAWEKRHMKTFVLTLCISLLCPLAVRASQNDDKLKSFPSNEEINLLVTQANRAMEQFKVIEIQAEGLLGKEAFDQDRKLFEHWAFMQKALKENPQAFNSSLGFEAVLDLDDASRNSAMCANMAATQALKDVANGTIEHTTVIVSLSQSCLDVSTLLYTVSENASSLYKKYLAWRREFSAQAMDAVQKCQDVLKELAAKKKQ
jgi:hypothetical protein